MKSNYEAMDERTPLTKTLPPDYVFMTNPNRLYRKQVHQFQCCICAIILTIFTLAVTIGVLYSVDNDIIDIIPDLPSDNASLQLLLAKSWPLSDDGIPEWQLNAPTPDQMEAAVAQGKKSLAARDSLEASGPSLPVNSPSYRHQVSIKTSARATYLARSAYVMEVATKQFVLNKGAGQKLSKSVGRGPALSSSWLPTEDCGEGPIPACPPTPYRSIDGTCNNPYKPNKWGVAMRPYRRQLASAYADGVSKPRVSSDGSPLPSARAVSVTVHRPAYRDDPKFSVMLAVWGQFMDHDVTATALSLSAGGKPISCCQNSSKPEHPECFPVYLSPDDSYYQQFSITCMEFVRSAPAPTCAMGPREQLNQVSSYLDGSVVYGNTPELSRSLRSYQGGRLKMMTTPNGQELLPISTNLDDGCNREAENAKGRYCFMTGDSRANENTHLTSVHLLMARQHNLVASQLADLNPEWDDERTYQEARRMVAAQMQHVTYNEFLPILLGPAMMEQLELSPQPSGYYTGYDPSVDVTISNNFATSAFRFAHTLLPALMKTVAKDWDSEESVEMHKMLFDPYKLYQSGALDKVLQGAINTKLERADSYFNTEVTQHLFQATGEDDKPSAPRYGLDLVSLNVQRGRDHGLPPYPAWRQYCGLKTPKTFDDMVGMVDQGSLDRMKSLYKSVDDIDMYTGALSEFPIEGGLVGPTITCLVSDQFKRLKQGDSFWYETDKQPQAFTPDQLDEIRKTSLAGIICDTSDEVTMVQPEVMKSTSPTNVRVPCQNIPRPDLTKWMDPTNQVLQGVAGAGAKSTRVTATVTGGTITTNAGALLWDGTVPITIPLPLFSTKKLATSAIGAGFGHGVQWQGVTTVTGNTAAVSGQFSYPIFTHGPIPLGTNYTIKWVNGEFTLNLEITSNTTDLTQLSLTRTYESPIFFNEAKVVTTDSKKKFVLGAAEDTPVVLGVQKLPIILIGTSSPDKTSFYWAGNATISIPPATKQPAMLSSQDAEKTSFSGMFNVVSGNVKLDSPDGSSSTLWNGELPAAIPLPLPYQLLPSSAGEMVSFGSGLEWSASVFGSSLEGSFSFPQYSRSVGMVSVNWLNGQFSLQLAPYTTGLEELLTPGVKYTSRIIFRQDPSYTNLQLESVFNNDVDAPDSLEDLMVESQEVIEGIVPAPVILHGTFSPDKATFYFNGKVILAVRPTKPSIDKQLKSLKGPELTFPPWGSPKFGGTVNSGYLTAGLDGGAPTTIWSGTVPVAIPMPTFFSPIYDALGGKSFLFGNGVVWSGTISGSTVKGTYTLPQSTWSMTGMKQNTWVGEFSFEMIPMWNTTLSSVLVPGAKYYSKIHFQGSKYETSLNSLDGVPGVDPKVTMAAPIILQGSHSLDKKTFYWSGSFIVAFSNKPALMFKLSTKTTPSHIVGKSNTTKPTASIQIDITSGTIVAGLIGKEPQLVWSGKLPATIPFGSLISKDSWSKLPQTDVMWSGEVKDDTFLGTFAVPTYSQNDTKEIVQWWAGNFSFKYTTKYGKQLENFVRPGKKYSFNIIFTSLQKSANEVDSNEGRPQNSLVKFTQEAQEVLGDSKPGKLVLRGKYYSKPFYCYIVPFCSDKQEYYWSGSAILAFPDPPKNNSANEVKKLSASPMGGASTQFGGKVVSGNVEGGLSKDTLNSWWSGEIPVKIPTSIFWTNKTGASDGLTSGRGIEWSGTLVGKTLKGTFSFPQFVLDYPIPKVQWWSGQFSFDIEPLWNTSLDGLVHSEVQYFSGIHLQGMKSTDNDDTAENQRFVLGTGPAVKQMAPIILQGTFSPDGSSFIWSGQFIMSVKTKPSYPTQNVIKSKVNVETDTSPLTPKPVKPKTTVSFTVITGQISASNGSDPVQVWGGERPMEINTDMLNPTGAPGAGVSLTWSADSLSPNLAGTFSVTVYTRNSSILLPVTWTGNFSMHYLIKWSGSFTGVVKPGSTYTCSLIFKEMAQLQSPQYNDQPAPKQFVLGGGDSTPCTLILNGKSYTKGVNPFYCKVVPFMCSKDPPTTWFSFNGDALLVVKPPVQMTAPPPPPALNQLLSVRRVNATVMSGSIVAGLESEYPTTLWSGNFPLNITLPVFWDSESKSGPKVPKEDIIDAHGVIWSGSQMGPRIEGSFSLPQYTKTGVKWWTGHFRLLFKTNWGLLGDLDDLIMPGVKYNTRIVFRDIHAPTTLMTPSQVDIDTSTRMPIVLLGTYTSKKMFQWYGNVIIGVRSKPWNMLNSPPTLSLSGPPPGTWPMKPKTRVGVMVNSGSLTNSVNGELIPVWNGIFPVKVPLAKFNITKGIHVLWTATSLYPKFTGNYSIPQYVGGDETFKIEWIDGTFSFDLMTLWNTSADVIQVGKQYATIVSSSEAKLTKAELEEMDSSMLGLIMDNVELEGAQIGKINLKGNITADNLYFSWGGEAWFYPEKNKTIGPKQLLQSDTGLLHAGQFGGAVYDGSVTDGSAGFFGLFFNNIWSGSLPVEIKSSMFWSSSTFGGSRLTHAVTWSATAVTDTYIEGKYSVPEFGWDGISKSVKWYNGKFKFYVRPLWNATLTSMVQPGVQYKSQVSFQGGSPLLTAEAFVPALPGIAAPLILQGTYSPDGSSFFWTGNFILNTRKIPSKMLAISTDSEKEVEQSLSNINSAKQGLQLAGQFGGTVVGGSITTGSSSFFNLMPNTIWSGEIPATIPFSAFYPGVFFGGSKLIRGMSWTATSVSETHVEGTYSIEQVSWTGFAKSVSYYTGNFKFNVKPLWNASLASMIQPNMPYYSKINFQGVPPPLLESTQLALDTDADSPGTKVPIILQGTYTPDSFQWNGNFIINFKAKPSKPEQIKVKSTNTALGALAVPSQFGGTMVGGSVTTGAASFFSFVPGTVWSGEIPATIPFSAFYPGSFIGGAKLIRGMSWTATAVSDSHVEGTYSVQQVSWEAFAKSVTYYSGNFKFDIKPLWNCSLVTVIQPGATYYSKINFQGAPPALLGKTQQALETIPDPAGIKVPIILQGTYAPDSFQWNGNFILNFKPVKPPKPDKIKGDNTETHLQFKLGSGVMAIPTQFGGKVSGGSVTTGTSSFFSLMPSTIWSGEIPAMIPFSSFYPGAFFGGSKLIRGMSWTATSVSDTYVEGTYSVQQVSWAGFSKSITYYSGNFKFDVTPLWDSSLTAMIQVGTPYYSKINFQGGPPSVLQSSQLALGAEPEPPGTKVPIILQGTYSPDSFQWNGNFILNFKVKPSKAQV